MPISLWVSFQIWRAVGHVEPDAPYSIGSVMFSTASVRKRRGAQGRMRANAGSQRIRIQALTQHDTELISLPGIRRRPDADENGIRDRVQRQSSRGVD